MANRYLDLDGAEQIRNSYQLIPEAFDEVEADIDAAAGVSEGIQAEVTEHKDSAAAHAAEHITYDGAVAGASNLKQAVDMQKTVVDNLVVSGDSSPAANQAKVDTFGVDQPTLKDRLDKDYLRTAAQLAEEIQQREAATEALAGDIATKAAQSALDVTNAAVAEKASQTDLNATNALVADTQAKANNPVGQIAANSIPSSTLKQSTDADKVQLANLSAGVIAAITGASPAGTIPANGSVTEEKLANGAGTTAKRTSLGESVNIRSFTNPVNFDTTAQTVTFPSGTRFMYRKLTYDIPSTVVLTIPSGFNYFSIFFNVVSKALSIKSNPELTTVTEDDMLVATGSVDQQTLSCAGNYAVDGAVVTDRHYSDFRVPIGLPLSGAKIDFNYSTQKMSIPADTTFFYNGGSYNQPTAVQVDLSTATSTMKKVLLNPVTGTFSAINFNGVTKKGMLLVAVVRTNTTMCEASVNCEYTINGLGRMSTGSFETFNNGALAISSSTRKAKIAKGTRVFYTDGFKRTSFDIASDTESNAMTAGFNSFVVTINISTKTLHMRSTSEYNSYQNPEIALVFGAFDTKSFTANGFVSFDGYEKSNHIVIPADGHLKVAAHRGSVNLAPENTIPAIKQAFNLGLRRVELDVKFTSDGEAVLLHDSTINRTGRNADGSAIATTIEIADITYADVLQYDFGIFKGERFKGTKLPKFEEVVIACKMFNMFLSIEVVDGFNAAQAAQLVSIVRKHGMLKSIEWVSFSFPAVLNILTYDPNATIGYITTSMSDTTIDDTATYLSGDNQIVLYPYAVELTEHMVQYSLNKGMEVRASGAATYQQMHDLVALGVSGFTVDDTNVYELFQFYM